MGRKWFIVACAALFCVGSTIQFVATGSTAVALLYAGRILGGIGVGASSAVVPIYIAEVSPAEIRGSLVGIYEVGIQTGTTIGFWIIYAVKQTMATGTTQWRFPMAFQLVPGGMLLVGMLFMPESPRWVALNRSHDEAARLLTKIRGLDADHPYIHWEMGRISEQVAQSRGAHAGEFAHHAPRRSFFSLYAECFSPAMRSRMFTGIVLMIAFQMSGTNAINYYSPSIFKSLGFQGTSSQFLATGIYGIVRFVCILIAMLFVADRVGRRTLIMVGCVGMGFCMWYIGAFLTATGGNNEHTKSGYSAIVFIYVYAAFFCFSFAGIPWIYCAEIFPTNIRAHATSITAATHWLFNLMLARSVPYMLSGIKGSTFFVFAACLTVSFFWAYFCMPETRGLSLEDIERLRTEPGKATRFYYFGAHRQTILPRLEPNADVAVLSSGSCDQTSTTGSDDKEKA